MTPTTYSNVIHIEGLDLAGKTTAAAALARQSGAELRRNSLTTHNPIFEVADQLRRAGTATAHTLAPLYVAALRHDLNALDYPKGAVVQDSTVLLRSIAYNTAIGDHETVEDLHAMLDRHPRYGRTIVLTASLEARGARLRMRQAAAPDEVAADDLLIHTNPAQFLMMEQTLVDIATTHFDADVLDTTPLTPAQVLDTITTLATSR
jgi:thymidylate kinase